jgi:hypothetical protein
LLIERVNERRLIKSVDPRQYRKYCFEDFLFLRITLCYSEMPLPCWFTCLGQTEEMTILTEGLLDQGQERVRGKGYGSGLEAHRQWIMEIS